MVRKIPKTRNVKIIFPSMITSISMIAGFASILMAAENRLVEAGTLILVAIILDGVDGKVARITNTASEFGVQLDSLADLVSFGVAPSVLFYRFYLYGRVEHQLFFLLPVIFMLCGAIRLARFNVTASVHGKSHFTGQPIPSAAGTLIVWIPLQNWMASSDVAFFVNLAPYLDPDKFFRYAVALCVVGSLSMISNMKFDTFNTFWFHLYPKKYMNYTVFALFLSLLFVHFVVFMFAIAVYYWVVMFTRELMNTIRKRTHDVQRVSSEEDAEIQGG